jgi:hypothetical protein
VAEIGSWNGHVFEVSPGVIHGVTGIKVSTGSETETKKSDKQQYVKRKHAKPADVTVSVLLSVLLGVDVRSEMLGLLEDARLGKSDYFYVGGSKLLPCKMMLTEASADEYRMTGTTITECKVTLTMKQCEKIGGGSASGSKKKSTKKSGSKSTAKKVVKAAKKVTAGNELARPLAQIY